jgi:hypothetical protein
MMSLSPSEFTEMLGGGFAIAGVGGLGRAKNTQIDRPAIDTELR